MAVSRDEAKDLLRDISKTERRSSTAYGYSMAAPHFFLWGVIWTLGYAGSYFRPHWAVAWPALSALGVIASFVIGWRTQSGTARTMDWRYGATVLAVILFVTAIFAIMPPRSGMQVAAFFPILVSLYYALMGIWTRGFRILITGAAIGALTVFGYFCLPAYFLLWMAGVGGAALILGGFWLRSL
jgi:hypothetical protein